MVVFWLLTAFTASAAPLTINVVSVDGNGGPVAAPSGYRWTVEEDRTKPSNPGQPSTPANLSLSFHPSYMPVVGAGRVGGPGNASTVDPDVARLYAQTPGALNLDVNKRYYVSVAAEGFQVGGTPVVFSNGRATATVTLIQYPVPTAQLSVLVFEDNFPVNSTAELPQEKGLEGFTVQLLEAGGTYGQSGGQVTQDAFGNPLGTTYSDDQGTVLNRGTGIILTDANGVAIIKNLYPAKYTVYISPRIRAGEDWHQTSTIEGTKGVDAWVKNNESPGFYEFGPPGYHVFYGFVNAGNSGCLQGKDPGGKNCVGMGDAGKSVTGRIVSVHDARPPALTLDLGTPVPQCWVALNNSTTSQGLYATACNKDSTFTIPNVLPGTYQLVVWDEPLDTIIGFSTVTVSENDTVVDLGDVSQLGWFGRYQGRVFQDIDGTGLPYFAADFNRPYVYVDPISGVEEERQQDFKKGDLKPSLGAGVASNIRFRDGSIYQSTTTKDDGTFAFTEVFPFFNWMVAEIDYARFKATSANIVVDNGGPIDPADNLSKLWGSDPVTPYTGLFGSNDPALAYDPWTRITPQPQPENGGAAFRTENCGETGQCAILLEGMSLYANQTNHIEWGKVPYKITENGGIAGIVYYAITRAEDDPRYAAAENWEPGVPRVQVNVFLDCDGDGKADKPANDGSGQCAMGGLSGADGYVADLPDVDNYPFCWRDPESCGAGSSPTKGPEDVKRSRAGGPGLFSYGDAFRWGAPGLAAGQQLHFGVGKTDAWDDSIPTDCPTRAIGEPPFAIPYGPAAGTSLDCWDGFRNWNQLRPGVFDGGFAFGRVAGQAELPMIIGAEGKGTYIVEAVAPPGYLHQGNGDKNVVFGDSFLSRPAALPHECVGIELDVPAELTLFPGEANPNFGSPQHPNNKWRKCDMKAVPLLPGMNAAPNFFLFTEAPVAAHGMGLLTDDLNNTFDPLSPNWGEKYAPPYVPISIQDWTGRELARTYSDQYGRYNFLVPSTFTINPPYPSGVMPNMIQACLNHPGPIPVLDANGAPVLNSIGQPMMEIDPYFSRRYTQQCYTLQYLPGKTTYLDTPMLPVSAFAAVEKTPLDCECADRTPAIYSATNGSNGPWVPSAGATLTIVSNGLVDVPNPAFDPTAVQADGQPVNPKALRTIQRDYGFGPNTGGGSLRRVTLGSTALTINAWSNGVITATVPSTVPPGEYQLTIRRGDNGKESVVGLTVHVGGAAPILVNQSGAAGTFKSIQAAINAADHGALITIAPGSYNEALILDKRIRLQGWGAGSTFVNPILTTGPAPIAWRALLNSKAITPSNPNGTFDMLPGQSLAVDPATGLPSLLGSEEQSGVLVLGKKFVLQDGSLGCANSGIPLRIDGLAITGAITGGGILANGYACNLQISNSRVFGNSGTSGGGVRIGHTTLVDRNAYVDAVNRNVSMHHNWIAENGSISVGVAGGNSGGGGGVTLGTGSNNYSVANNYICGNFSLSDGAGVSHLGLSTPASISGNTVMFNQSFDGGSNPNGAGLSVAALLAPAGGLAQGTGDVTVTANLFQGNQAGAGSGGGVSIARTLPADDVVLTNNMIINNVAGYAGGGVALTSVTPNVRLVNNTVASNVSTATVRMAFGAAGPIDPSNSQIAGVALMDGPAPTLLNNITWGNRSFIFLIGGTQSGLYNPGSTVDVIGNITANPIPSYQDIGAVAPTSGALAPTFSLLTTGATGFVDNGTNLFEAAASTALFSKASDFTDTLQSAVTVDEGGNFVNVIYSPLTLWEMDAAGYVLATLRADYHIQAGSAAQNNGANSTPTNFVPVRDIDAQLRVNPVDIGADESIGPAPARVVPLSLTFGNQALGTTSATQTVTLSNPVGNPPLNVTGLQVSGNFRRPTGNAGGSCSFDNQFFLNAGASCTINVVFNPTGSAAGLRTGSLSITSGSAVPPPPTVTLHGTATVPFATVNPTSLMFGNQLLGTTSAGQTITLTNPAGNPQMNVTRPSFSGNFRRPTGNAGGSCSFDNQFFLNSGASCTINVVFNPPLGSATGVQTGSLTITSSLPQIVVGLSGTATVPAPAVVAGFGTTITPIDFGVDARGGPTGQTLAVMNVSNPVGNPTMNVATALSGANANNWTRINGVGLGNCFAGGGAANLAAGANCTIYYRFQPPGGGGNPAGQKTATVTLSTSTANATFAPVSSSVMTGLANP
jgi:hypothetical protein